MSKGGRVYIGLTVLFALVCQTFLIRLDKGSIHLSMDAWHTNVDPTFFKYITHLGDGLAFVAAVAILLLLRRRGAMVLSVASAGVTVLLLVGVLKQVVFPGVDRPWGFFEEGALRLIPELEQHTNNSFPSGHTTAAFALYGILAIWINRRWASVLLFVLAATVGYSRIFLNQHFLLDVFVGSMLGTAIAWVNYWLFSKMKHPRMRDRLL
ncbi:MAG: phosphatase PAP2 family protein [Flavobacteriia bacterium]|nr:phosphatase PAP2 family protein [Flavobacteriia bacterium]